MKNLNLIKSILSPKFLVSAALLALPVSAMAQYDRGTIEDATVLSADPIYRTVRTNNPVEQCWDEKVRLPSRARSHTPKILGAIIGAAVGHEFGKGRGKDLATVAGAVLGGSIGRDTQAHHGYNNGRVVYEQRCEIVDNFSTEQRIDGYDVTYRYNGQVYSTYTQRDPGATIKVSVNVVPVE